MIHEKIDMNYGNSYKLAYQIIQEIKNSFIIKFFDIMKAYKYSIFNL